jgi:hypothetical protein
MREVDERIREYIFTPAATENFLDGSLPYAKILDPPPGNNSLFLEGGDVGAYSITNTTSENIDSTNLAGTMTCSGKRPVKVTIALAANKSSAGYGIVGFRWDGVLHNHRVIYIEATANNDHYSGFGVVPIRRAAKGSHLLEITAFQSGGGTLTLYSDFTPDGTGGPDNNRVVAVAEEF